MTWMMLHILVKILGGSEDTLNHLLQATWLVSTMSRVILTWQYSTTSEPLLVILDSWRHTITWLAVHFSLKYIEIMFIPYIDLLLLCLNWLWIIFDSHCKGNALKEAGRVEDAIHCYRVGLPLLLLECLMCNLWFCTSILFSFLFVYVAMLVSST